MGKETYTDRTYNGGTFLDCGTFQNNKNLQTYLVISFVLYIPPCWIKVYVINKKNSIIRLKRHVVLIKYTYAVKLYN
jgi:hypothetical protein